MNSVASEKVGADRKTEPLKNEIEKNLNDRKVYTVVEEQPEFPGGTEAMWEFLGQHIKYPETASKANVQGRVFLSFVVTETGETEDIMILKGIGYGCDAEAIRVLKLFPKWKPAKTEWSTGQREI